MKRIIKCRIRLRGTLNFTSFSADKNFDNLLFLWQYSPHGSEKARWRQRHPSVWPLLIIAIFAGRGRNTIPVRGNSPQFH